MTAAPSSNTSPSVHVQRHGAVLVVTIDRPAVRNAIDRATSEALARAMDELDADPALAVGILTGAGGHFCTGMDLKAFLRGERVELPGRGLAGMVQFDHGHDVVLDRHATEDRGLLRQIAQTHAGALVHRLGRDVLAVQPDGAAVGRNQAGDHVETGGLAGPVRPQQARDLTALDMKGDVAHHLPLAEGAGDVIDPQAGRARGLGRRGCRGLDHIEG